MTAIQDTAYPRIRSSLTIHELARIYTPTPDELILARRTTRGTGARICFLVLLKTFQRLGSFMTLTDVPPSIVQHIADTVGGTVVSRDDLIRYAAAGTRGRHLAAIRAHLYEVTPAPTVATRAHGASPERRSTLKPSSSLLMSRQASRIVLAELGATTRFVGGVGRAQP